MAPVRSRGGRSPPSLTGSTTRIGRRTGSDFIPDAALRLAGRRRFKLYRLRSLQDPPETFDLRTGFPPKGSPSCIYWSVCGSMGLSTHTILEEVSQESLNASNQTAEEDKVLRPFTAVKVLIPHCKNTLKSI